MHKYKLVKKYFFNKEFFPFGLRTRYFLYKQNGENINKIKNNSFLQFLKTFEVNGKDDSIKLIDLLLNFPIEKYMLFDKLFLTIRIIFKKRKKGNVLDQAKASNHNNIIILCNFEEEFIKSSIRDRFDLANLNVNSSNKNKQKKSNKKVSIYKFQNKRNSQLFSNNKTSNNHISNPELYEALLNDNQINSGTKILIEKYYIKLLQELKSNKNLYNFPTINLKTELKLIKSKIREKKIAKIKKFINKFTKIVNIKNFLDLKNTKNTIQATFTVLSKYISLYKLSMNELVEGQREVTQNKNFRFEDGETVKEKIENFERKLKENVNLNDHYEKKEKL